MKTESDFTQLINIFYQPTNKRRPFIIKLVGNVLLDQKFFMQSGSGYKGQHHYGTGGLAQHTYEVMEKCLNNADTTCNKEILILASLYHDIGKLYDYEQDENYEWVPTDHKRNIHHISKSAMIFYERANLHGYPEKDREHVLHCILSHHMRREWGSPVSPNSKEAWLLCLCDNISARLADFDTWDYLRKKYHES